MAFRRSWLQLFPLLVFGALIFYGSSQTRWLLDPPEFFSADKLYHVVEYGILGVLVARVLIEYGFFHSRQKKILAILLVSFLYGLSDEFHQWFVPGRFATWGDVLADSIGGGLGGWLFLKFDPLSRWRRSG